jgi:hypothetical protein
MYANRNSSDDEWYQLEAVLFEIMNVKTTFTVHSIFLSSPRLLIPLSYVFKLLISIIDFQKNRYFPVYRKTASAYLGPV